MTKSFATVKAEAVVVRDESVANANTANRVGTVMVDTVDTMEASLIAAKAYTDTLSNAGYIYLGQATVATSPSVTDVPDNQKLYYTFDAPVGTSIFTEFFGFDDNALVLVNTHYPKRYLLMWSGVGYWVTVAETVMLGSDVDVYNVTKHNPPISGYHSFPNVLLSIPETEIRKEGLIISFSTAVNTWVNYQCINVGVFTGSNGWVKLPTQIEVNAKVATADIVNNLTSTNAGVPLSAAQGKVLGDRTLDGLPNVTTTGKHEGDLLQWDSTASKWIDISPRKLSMDGAGFLGFCTPSTTPPIFSGYEYEFVYYIYDAPIGSSSLANINASLTFTETKKKRYYIVYRATGWDKVADDNFTYLSAFAFFNVTTGIPLISGYYGLPQAILAVYNLDATLAKEGLVITFEASDTVWVSYQFTGSGFTGTNGWTQVPTRSEVNLNATNIENLRLLGSVYKGVIASESVVSPTLGTSDRVHYTYNCAVGGAIFANFGGLTLPSSSTIKRYIISWNGSAWVGTADTVLLGVNVKDTLTETVVGNALDATQGKVLNDKVALYDDNEFRAAAAAIDQLAGRIQSLEEFITESRFSTLTVDTLEVVENLNMYKLSNMLKIGTPRMIGFDLVTGGTFTITIEDVTTASIVYTNASTFASITTQITDALMALGKTIALGYSVVNGTSYILIRRDYDGETSYNYAITDGSGKVKKTASPIAEPDFVGQLFVDNTSATPNAWQAMNVNSVSDWKQITN